MGINFKTPSCFLTINWILTSIRALLQMDLLSSIFNLSSAILSLQFDTQAHPHLPHCEHNKYGGDGLDEQREAILRLREGIEEMLEKKIWDGRSAIVIVIVVCIVVIMVLICGNHSWKRVDDDGEFEEAERQWGQIEVPK
ncbi:hypothetical protein Scep_009721 [Stephania cephalantha]|uniref:Transmembrane protein n=1 Tax=Stephania cephalantha TaxID=152367 RepID=A0AAP0JVZ7_9MAGN